MGNDTDDKLNGIKIIASEDIAKGEALMIGTMGIGKSITVDAVRIINLDIPWYRRIWRKICNFARRIIRA